MPEAAAEKRAAALAEFNARFIFVNEAGKATIFAPRHDHVLNRRCIDRMDTGDLAKLYMNRTVPSGADKHGSVVYEPVAPWWLKNTRSAGSSLPGLNLILPESANLEFITSGRDLP